MGFQRSSQDFGVMLLAVPSLNPQMGTDLIGKVLDPCVFGSRVGFDEFYTALHIVSVGVIGSMKYLKRKWTGSGPIHVSCRIHRFLSPQQP
jgi:hypothetical protein